jgi:hypothetical protein
MMTNGYRECTDMIRASDACLSLKRQGIKKNTPRSQRNGTDINHSTSNRDPEPSTSYLYELTCGRVFHIHVLIVGEVLGLLVKLHPAQYQRQNDVTQVLEHQSSAEDNAQVHR